jgi:hypothetical protein
MVPFFLHALRLLAHGCPYANGGAVALFAVQGDVSSVRVKDIAGNG